MKYKNKREAFRKKYKSGTTGTDALCRELKLSKRIVSKWIKEDFKNRKKGYRKPRRSGYNHVRLISVREQYRKLYRTRKYSLVELSQKLKVSRGALHKWQLQDFPDGKKWRYKYFIRLYNIGFTIEDITYFLHCERSSALRYLRRYINEGGKICKVRSRAL